MANEQRFNFDPQTAGQSAHGGGIDRIIARLQRLQNPDPTPLLLRWRDIAVEDNRAKVLAGQDGNGQPLRPTTYRNSQSRKTAFQRKSVFGTNKHPFGGFGPHAAGLNNNLTTAEYKKLTGPPLAPRGEASRVITNLETGHGQDAENRWFVTARWGDVVSVKGRPFLMAHFGPRRSWMPRRDLRGIRPVGMVKVREALSKWVNYLLKGGTF